MTARHLLVEPVAPSLSREWLDRRVLPVAVRTDEGLPSVHTAGIQPAQRELVFMLHFGHYRLGDPSQL
jgi:hypothetical protein